MTLFAQELFVNAQAKGSLNSPEYVEAHERSKRLAAAEGIDAALEKITWMFSLLPPWARPGTPIG